MNRALYSYIETALWSSGKEFDDKWIEDIDAEVIENAEQDLDQFFQAIEYLEVGEDDSHIAHNFWLTRNHHGAGFWDGDYPEHGDKLTGIAHLFGEVYLYIGDDGKVYQY